MTRVLLALAAASAATGCASTSASVRETTHAHANAGNGEWLPWPYDPVAPRLGLRPETPASPRDRAADSVGERAAQAARRWVGLKTLRRVSTRVPDDCSGLIRLAYLRAGREIRVARERGEGLVSAMWRHAERRGATTNAPRPGDLVFFRETYDRNRDGRVNDGITHAGVVDHVESNGTIVFIHRGGAGVLRARVNEGFPGVRSRDGVVLNDYVRKPDRSGAPRLAGELLVGFAASWAFTPERLVTSHEARRGRR